MDFPGFVAERCESGQVQSIRCELQAEDDVKALAALAGRKFDLCVFLAANTSVPQSVSEPAVDLLANTLTVLNVLKAIRIERFIFLSSGAVYDGIGGPVGPDTPLAPSLPYAISKLAAELYTRRAYADGKIGGYALIRFFGAYGMFEPSRKIYSRLVEELGVQNRTIFEIYGDGSNLVDAMYADDAVAAILKVCGDTRPAVTVDLARGEPLAVAELVSRAARHFLSRDVTIRKAGKAHEAIHFVPDAMPFQELYDFRCSISLEEGLDRMLAQRLQGANAR